MATIRPFQCLRPNENVVGRVAALPYDVYNRQEAKNEVIKEPLSFLAIDRAETQFEDSVDIYDDKVYKKARDLLDCRIADGIFIRDEAEYYYIYELVMDGRSQTGIVACSSIDDYQNNFIKKHEKTREEKEIDRIKHVDICNAQTGPIFLAYRSDPIINSVVDQTKTEMPLYHFVSTDGVAHNVWKVKDEDKSAVIKEAFAQTDSIYIADGHHRAASAVKVGLKHREGQAWDGTEEFNYFLSVLFPDDQLMILPYNRAVKDLNGFTTEEFIQRVGNDFKVTPMGATQYLPRRKGEFGMYLKGGWYKLEAMERLRDKNDSVGSLDVSLLQNYLLGPILGIDDPRIDERIDFIGGIRGLDELEKRVGEDMEVAFSMYPTSIQELFSVADEGKLMPPKSTWFEPKLRSGLFIHQL